MKTLEVLRTALNMNPSRCCCCGVKFNEDSLLWLVIAGGGTPGWICTRCHERFFGKEMTENLLKNRIQEGV